MRMDKGGDEDRAKTAGEGGAALGIALDAARGDPALAADARTLLREQARLARIQADQLDEEAALTRWSLRIRHASELMKFAFELSVALVLLAVVAALGTAMWSAAHDNGLVIEAFSVPPDLAARGMSGEVVASQLLDKLARMQAETNSMRPAGTYRNNWGDDIKVDIPDTGISIGELNHYLRRWLGHETHITGEIYRVPSGIAVTARGQDAGTTFTGRETDLDTLLQKAAEAIYAETQPYRYAAFLAQMNRNGEAIVVLTKLAASANPAERAWGDSLLGNLYTFYGRPRDALATLREGVAADPANAHAWDNLANTENQLGHLEDSWRHTQRALSLYDNGSVAFDRDRVAIIKLFDQTSVAEAVGDFLTAEAIDEQVRAMPDINGSHNQALADQANNAAAEHDPSRSRILFAEIHPADANARVNLWFELASVAFLADDWPKLARLLDPRAVFQMAPAPFHPALQSIYRRLPQSMLAESKAEQGDIATARRLIATTPADCYDCVRMRGRIDTLGRNWAGAAFWFALASQQGPSIPTAYCDWGTMLLDKGDLDAAITKFAAANAKAPRFADPLEGWGEALIRAKRSDLAIDKFQAANRFAPNWGRLHLQWGEALFYLGRKNEAAAQWNLAGHLDLTTDERTVLARFKPA